MKRSMSWIFLVLGSLLLFAFLPKATLVWGPAPPPFTIMYQDFSQRNPFDLAVFFGGAILIAILTISLSRLRYQAGPKRTKLFLPCLAEGGIAGLYNSLWEIQQVPEGIRMIYVEFLLLFGIMLLLSVSIASLGLYLLAIFPGKNLFPKSPFNPSLLS